MGVVSGGSAAPREALAFAGVVGQRDALRSGAVTASDLVGLSLRRIERLDPHLNAFRRVFSEEALREAELAQVRLRGGDERPLLGIPVAIKDNVDVADDVTTQGTRAYGAPAAHDCEIVRRVREAGAIVVGRTHCPPLCAMTCTESAAWGITVNPWNPACTPGGSSGGSAAAVASGMVPFAFGSDFGGSIRVPSAFCGLFGLKTQRGRMSLAPMAEHCYGMTVVGWLTRSVRDAAIVYDATMGSTDRDADHAPSPTQSFSAAAASDPGRLRIAWSIEPPSPMTLTTRVDERVKHAVRMTAELLHTLGHDVAERTPNYPQALAPAAAVRMLAGIAADLASLPHPERVERRFRRMGALGSLLSHRALAWARAVEPAISARVNAIFDSADVLVLPVTPEVPFEAGRWQDRGALATVIDNGAVDAFAAPWNVTGQPAAAVPAGFTNDGLPLAVQLVGRPNDENTLLALAAQLEATRPWTDRKPALS